MGLMECLWVFFFWSNLQCLLFLNVYALTKPWFWLQNQLNLSLNPFSSFIYFLKCVWMGICKACIYWWWVVNGMRMMYCFIQGFLFAINVRCGIVSCLSRVIFFGIQFFSNSSSCDAFHFMMFWLCLPTLKLKATCVASDKLHESRVDGEQFSGTS